jgi:hypothetical protein
MKTPHTPGPWNIIKHAAPEGYPQFGIYAGDGTQRDFVIVRNDNAAADVELIAAAPEMLAALREIESNLTDHPEAKRGNSKVHYLMHAARAAIAKAEGRSA